MRRPRSRFRVPALTTAHTIDYDGIIHRVFVDTACINRTEPADVLASLNAP